MNQMIMQNDDFFYIKVQNGGGFTARAYVSYWYNGEQYGYMSRIITVGSSDTVMLPNGAQNVHLMVTVSLYSYVRMAYSNYLPSDQPSCFYLYGTIYSPRCIKMPCQSTDSIPPNTNTCCNCCNSCCNVQC